MIRRLPRAAALTAALALSVAIPRARAAPAAPKTGSLRVISSPMAQVYVEGEAIGLTPIAAHVLRPGRYQVELRIADGRSLNTTVEVKAGGRLTVAHKFGPPRRGGPGTLHVTSDPWAQVFLDGRAAGDTPLTGYRAASRSYDLELRTTDGRSYKRIVYVEAGRTTRLHHRFPKPSEPKPTGAFGWLKVDSDPASEVHVDGKRVGRTPLDDLDVAAGIRVVELKTADGRTHRRQVRIGRDKTTVFRYRFPPKEEVEERPTLGQLSVTCNVQAEVLIDGKPVGWTPLIEQPVKPGRRRVTLVAGKGRRQSYTVVIVAGRTRTVAVRFPVR